jgi:hypothetical protein
LKAVICLNERHPNYPKTFSAKIKFARHWLSLSTEDVKKAIPDERLLKNALEEFDSLGLKDEATLSTLSEELLKNFPHSINHVHEYIKTR